MIDLALKSWPIRLFSLLDLLSVPFLQCGIVEGLGYSHPTVFTHHCTRVEKLAVELNHDSNLLLLNLTESI